MSGIFDKLTGRGALSEADVDVAMREVRRALLEADVALEVVRSFIDKVKEKAVGAEIVKSITPGQMVVKIVHDVLVETLGSRRRRRSTCAPRRPLPILMVGLQGSGKTTTTAKIAKRLQERDKRKVLMASLDTQPPRRAGATRHSRPAGEGRNLADRQGRDADRRSPGAPCRKPASAASTS